MNTIQDVFNASFHEYKNKNFVSNVQSKAAFSIMNCKTNKMGFNKSTCQNCNHEEIHYNSCKNRNCPNCQIIQKDIWIDSRKAELVDTPYFHVVFTIPDELNPIFFANQNLLYDLLHKTVSSTILELAQDKKFLGATPGIIQVLHTWGQKLNYHPHIHAILTGGGITKSRQFISIKNDFFIPVKVLSKLFRGKFLHALKTLFKNNLILFPNSIKHLQNNARWQEFCNILYKKEWISYIKETFKNFGNAIDYLARYTHRIAITNHRIIKLDDNNVTFRAKDYKNNNQNIEITITNQEFIRRFLMHVLPKGFRKIRYYGFLNNRFKKQNLILIANLTNKTLFKATLKHLPIAEVIKIVYNVDINLCPVCKSHSLFNTSFKFHKRE